MDKSTNGSKPGKNGPDPKPPVGGLGSAQFKLTAEELHDENKQNHTGFKDKYNTKVVELSGKVGIIGPVDEKKGQREVCLAVQDKDSPRGVSCFVKDTKVAGKLSRGQTIRIKGNVMAVAQIFVWVTDCEIVEFGPDMAVRMSAAEIAKIFTLDNEGARKKYDGQTFVVTGTIAKMGRTGSLLVDLKGDDTTDIACLFNHLSSDFEEKAAEKLKVGQKVTFAGKFESFATSEGRVGIVNTVIVEGP